MSTLLAQLMSRCARLVLLTYSAADAGEIGFIRSATCDQPIARDLGVLSPNRGIRNHQMMFLASEIAFVSDHRLDHRCLISRP